MSKETTPYGEAVAGIALMLYGAIIGLRAGKSWWSWHHGLPVEPWQSQILAWGFLLGGLLLVAHATVRKLK